MCAPLDDRQPQVAVSQSFAKAHVQSSQSRSIGRLNGSIAADSASASLCRFSSSVSWISCRCSCSALQPQPVKSMRCDVVPS